MTSSDIVSSVHTRLLVSKASEYGWPSSVPAFRSNMLYKDGPARNRSPLLSVWQILHLRINRLSPLLISALLLENFRDLSINMTKFHVGSPRLNSVIASSKPPVKTLPFSARILSAQTGPEAAYTSITASTVATSTKRTRPFAFSKARRLLCAS